MAKTIQTRVQNKHDTEENWGKASGFIPLMGEIIIYDPDLDNEDPSKRYPGVRVKIGDGETPVNSLPFALDETDLRNLINDTNSAIENLTAIWIGTRAQWEEAKDNIATGTVVILTDDNNIAAGGSGENAGGATAKLGTAILGTMILGQE